nr:VOC family protein [Sphaerisporangium cinnabarinum]
MTADREHDHPATDPFDATMVPALPCQDIDELRDFWTALGFDVTYRQLRPNPYLAVRRGGVDLHYFGLDGLAPQDSYSTCIVVVDDTAPVFEAFAAGLRARYGRLPLTGFPRITRPRRRANAGGTTGFSLVDPAGNWVRVVRRSPAADASTDTSADNATDTSPGAAGDSSAGAYAARPEGRLARALDDAVVQADSHGDPAQARKILAGALRRAGEDVGAADRVRALAYLAELAARTDDAAAARTYLDDLDALAGTLDPEVRDAVGPALAEAADVRAALPG